METPNTQEKEKLGGFAVTNQQKKIIEHVVGHQVTITAAGAGVGKTYTTVAACLHLVKEHGASLDQFVFISFTNEAANTLKGKLQEAVFNRVKEAGSTEERFFWRQQQERLAAAYVGTIHGFCRQLLKLFAYQQNIAYDAKVSFAQLLRDEVFKEAMLHHRQTSEAAAVYGGNSQMADYTLLALMSDLYEYIRNQEYRFEDVVLWTAQQQPEDAGKPYRISMAQLVQEAAEAYDLRKKQEQVLDSHDLLQATHALLTRPHSGTRVIKQIAKRYKYLFVDEFQDTDVVQKDIVEAFVEQSNMKVLIVGDQKQSIYSWRGTQVQMLYELSKRRMPEGKPLPMNISRRPTRRFLKLANALFDIIGQNEDYSFLKEPLEPYDKTVSGQSDPPPMIYRTGSKGSGKAGRIQETAHIITELLSGDQTLEHKPGVFAPIRQGDIVILTRTNRIQQEYVEGLRTALAPLGITVQSDAGESFYTQPEVVSVTYMLQLLLSYPEDDAALTFALDSPFLRDAAQEQMREEKLRQVQRPVSGSPISESFKFYNEALHHHIVQLQKLMRTATVPQILEQLYRLFSIREYYYGKQNQQAIENLEYLREVARNLFSEDQALTLQTFLDFLRTSALMGRKEERVEAPKDLGPSDIRKVPPFIRVMTIHSAKGLEFPIVIIPEVQAPLIRKMEEQNQFLVIDQHGLEVNLDIVADQANHLTTLSPAYEGFLQRDQLKLRQEELRVFYVAVTRAEHCVVFVGSEKNRPLAPQEEYYSWQDEIVRALPHLQHQEVTSEQ